MGNQILIIDDEYHSRETLRFALEGVEFSVETAGNGAEGIRKSGDLHPDAILLDLLMPEMNGFEVCQRLRGDPQTARIPILVVSSLEDRESMLEAFRAGADDFISKPFKPVELRERLARLYH
jgi:CheY-like chemotaxis protein